MHVGQAKVPAGRVICQFFVGETHEVQHGGVQVVDVDWLVHSPVAKVVSRPVGHSATCAAAGHPDCVPMVIVVSARGFPVGPEWDFHGGRAPEFSSADDQGLVEQSSLGQIG